MARRRTPFRRAGFLALEALVLGVVMLGGASCGTGDAGGPASVPDGDAGQARRAAGEETRGPSRRTRAMPPL